MPYYNNIFFFFFNRTCFKNFSRFFPFSWNLPFHDRTSGQCIWYIPDIWYNVHDDRSYIIRQQYNWEECNIVITIRIIMVACHLVRVQPIGETVYILGYLYRIYYFIYLLRVLFFSNFTLSPFRFSVIFLKVHTNVYLFIFLRVFFFEFHFVPFPISGYFS